MLPACVPMALPSAIVVLSMVQPCDLAFKMGCYAGVCWPRFKGRATILSSIPTVDKIMLGSEEASKGQAFGSLDMQLVCMRTLPLAGNACKDNDEG